MVSGSDRTTRIDWSPIRYSSNAPTSAISSSRQATCQTRDHRRSNSSSANSGSCSARGERRRPRRSRRCRDPCRRFTIECTTVTRQSASVFGVAMLGRNGNFVWAVRRERTMTGRSICCGHARRSAAPPSPHRWPRCRCLHRTSAALLRRNGTDERYADRPALRFGDRIWTPCRAPRRSGALCRPLPRPPRSRPPAACRCPARQHARLRLRAVWCRVWPGLPWRG